MGSVHLHNEGGLTRHIQDHREQEDCRACQELPGDEILQGALQARGGGRESIPTTTTAMVRIQSITLLVRIMHVTQLKQENTCTCTCILLGVCMYNVCIHVHMYHPIDLGC